jgi:sugar O-acyltransferase (sialic acid O-acetyltransferase NeuD family)
MKKNIIIIGAGLHSKAIINCVDKKKYTIKGFIDKKIKGSQILGTDNYLLDLKKKNLLLINGIYFNFHKNIRIEIFKKFKKMRYEFITVKSKTAIIAENTFIGEGSQILNGAIINNKVTIGFNTIINTGVIVDHDVDIGNHCTIAPGSIICGNVKLGENVNIGPGVKIFNGVTIGKNAFIQGGVTIKKNIKSYAKIFNINAL